jgi:hypothetical protein
MELSPRRAKRSSLADLTEPAGEPRPGEPRPGLRVTNDGDDRALLLTAVSATTSAANRMSIGGRWWNQPRENVQSRGGRPVVSILGIGRDDGGPKTSTSDPQTEVKNQRNEVRKRIKSNMLDVSKFTDDDLDAIYRDKDTDGWSEAIQVAYTHILKAEQNQMLRAQLVASTPSRRKQATRSSTRDWEDRSRPWFLPANTKNHSHYPCSTRYPR